MEPPPAGYRLDPDGGERLSFSGAEFVIRASADTTGGAFSIVQEIEPLDTPLHVHEHEDELFYVLEGEHVFQCGEDEFHVGPGGLVFAPRGIPHAQLRKVPRTGRILTMVSPADSRGSFGSSRRRSATARSAPTPTRASRRGTASAGSPSRALEDFDPIAVRVADEADP